MADLLLLANEVRQAQARLDEIERRVAFLRQEATFACERANEAQIEYVEAARAVSAAEGALCHAAHEGIPLPIEARRG